MLLYTCTIFVSLNFAYLILIYVNPECLIGPIGLAVY